MENRIENGMQTKDARHSGGHWGCWDFELGLVHQATDVPRSPVSTSAD